MWRILTRFFHQLASPPHFYRWSGLFAPWFGGLAVVLMGIGLYGGLLMAPADYQQGEAFRIIYVHVPSAYLSLMSYMLMATAAEQTIDALARELGLPLLEKPLRLR